VSAVFCICGAVSSPVSVVDLADCHRSQSSTNMEHVTEMVLREMAVVNTAPNPSRSMTLIVAAHGRPHAVGATPFPWPAPMSGKCLLVCVCCDSTLLACICNFSSRHDVSCCITFVVLKQSKSVAVAAPSAGVAVGLWWCGIAKSHHVGNVFVQHPNLPTIGCT